MGIRVRAHTGVLLAAGGSRRLGQPKQLLQRGGQSLLRCSVQLLLDTGADPVLVIIGAHAARMRAELAGCPVSIIEHPGWASGLAGTLQCAASACQQRQASRILLMGTDQPRLTLAHLEALLVSAGADHDALSGYAGVAGIPALLRLSTLLQATGLRADAGLRQLLRGRDDVNIVPCHALADDLDTLEDLAHARRRGWIDAPG